MLNIYSKQYSSVRTFHVLTLYLGRFFSWGGGLTLSKFSPVNALLLPPKCPYVEYLKFQESTQDRLLITLVLKFKISFCLAGQRGVCWTQISISFILEYCSSCTFRRNRGKYYAPLSHNNYLPYFPLFFTLLSFSLLDFFFFLLSFLTLSLPFFSIISIFSLFFPSHLLFHHIYLFSLFPLSPFFIHHFYLSYLLSPPFFSIISIFSLSSPSLYIISIFSLPYLSIFSHSFPSFSLSFPSFLFPFPLSLFLFHDFYFSPFLSISLLYFSMISIFSLFFPSLTLTYP